MERCRPRVLSAQRHEPVHPFYKAAEYGIGRRITTYEYRRVVNYAMDKGLVQGYMQQKSSAKEEYTPSFDLTGV